MMETQFKKTVDFIRELYNTPEAFIPLHEPRFVGNEKKYLIDAIDSTFVSSVGEYVNRFEEMMTQITGAKYAVAVVNGTAALHISLKLAGVQQGDEVLTQALSFVATPNAISYEKAIPHFIDVNEHTLGMGADALQTRLDQVAEMRDGVCWNKETNRKIAACVPMHTFGFPVEIEKIVAMCDSYNIPVVEDAAESLGSYVGEQHTGTFGLLGTVSLNGNKVVTSGGGGVILTNDKEIAERAKHLTTTAKVPHKWDYVHNELGYNYRMPNLNAALACAQLEQLDRYIGNKKETAQRYQAFFEKISGVDFIQKPAGSTPNYWLHAVQLENRAQRDKLLEYTNGEGVMTRPVWELLNRLPMYIDCPSGDLSVSSLLADTLVNITSSVRN